jgi:hypothetical protein
VQYSACFQLALRIKYCIVKYWDFDYFLRSGYLKTLELLDNNYYI